MKKKREKCFTSFLFLGAHFPLVDCSELKVNFKSNQLRDTCLKTYYAVIPTEQNG